MGQSLASKIQTRRVWCYQLAEWCMRLGVWLAKQPQLRIEGHAWESQVERVDINFHLKDDT